ncbi:MAG: Calx-beta domain-containing protein, partial [Planctomycetota bacterium]
GETLDGTAPMVNDDAATLTLSGGGSQTEGTSHTFTATLSHAVQGGFTVAYNSNDGTTNPAVAGSDYTDNDGTFTFLGNAGENMSWTVLTSTDNTVELNETFTATLGTPSAAGITVSGSPQTGTIANDDQAIVSITNVSQAENLTPQVFTVSISNPVDVAVSATANTSNGTATTGDSDYSAVTNQTVSFSINSTTSQTVNVTIINDNKVESNETYSLILSALSASGRNVIFTGSGSTLTGSGTIVNDDVSTLTLTGGGSGNEGNSGQSGKIFTATLSNPVQDGFTLNFTTNDGSATTADSDYADNDGSVGFTGTANEMQTITVNVNGDHQVEADETFTMNMNSLSNTSLGSSITLVGSPQTWTILNDEVDYGDAPNSGQSGFPLTYKTVLPDTAAFHNAVFGIRLGANIDGEDNGQPTATSDGDDNTFLDDEDGVTLPASFITGTTQTITVNASAAGFIHGWIDWGRNGHWNSGTEQVLSNVPVVVGNNIFNITTPAGASVGTSFARFRYTTAPGGLPPASEAIAADGEVEDYQVLIQNTVLSINDVTQVETNAGTTTFAFTVSLNNPAPAGGVTFDIATQDGTAQDDNPVSEDNDYVPQLLNGQSIPMGSSTYTFNVTVNGDAIVETNETFFVNVTNVVGVGVSDGQGLGTITNDDMATLTLSGGGSQTEGTSHTFTATLSHAVQGGFTVAYTTNDGTATTADSDYTDNDNTLTFTGNANESMNITVLTTTDSKVELDETFTVALGAPSAASITVAGSPQTGTITNDDSAVLAIAANVSQLEATTP